MQGLVDLRSRIMLVVEAFTFASSVGQKNSVYFLKVWFTFCRGYLDVVIGHPNKLDLDSIMPYDKAVSALRKIC